MAHSDSKQPACANCHYEFAPSAPNEFCPRCGQQNHALNIGFGHVAEEFLEGVFHFDGKVFRTLKLLLFRPGELTRQFLAGHRVPYVPPIRLYVFISFIFFFLLSVSSHDKGKGMHVHVGEVEKARPRQLTISVDNTPALSPALLSSLPEHLSAAQADSVLRHHGVPLTSSNRLEVQHLPHLMRLTPEELSHQVFKSLSLMLFVLMPLAALLLWATYLRQQPYYLSHLIFAIHLHCFVFVVLMVLLGLEYLPLPGGTGLVLALIIPVYLLLALRHLYGESWTRTLLKGAGLAFSYSVLLGFGVLLATGLGLWLL